MQRHQRQEWAAWVVWAVCIKTNLITFLNKKPRILRGFFLRSFYFSKLSAILSWQNNNTTKGFFMKKLGLALLLSTAVFSAWGMEYTPEDDQVESYRLVAFKRNSEPESIVAVTTKGGKEVRLSKPISEEEYLAASKIMTAYVETEESIEWREQQQKNSWLFSDLDTSDYHVGDLSFRSVPKKD